MRAQLSALIIALILVTTTAGCAKSVHSYRPAGAPAIDDAYMDLEPGWKILIIVSLLKSGGLRATDLVQEGDSETLSYSSRDVIGYTVSNYTAVGKRDGGVRLQFAGAETTRDGKTIRELKPPSLPLQLPKGTQHIRLVYEIRVSHTDHNMAIVASKRLDALDAFTKQLEKNPDVCSRTSDVFCSWVPTGVAVRPEPQ